MTEYQDDKSALPEDAVIKMQPIGTIETGIDGSSQYLLVTRKDGDLTPEQAEAYVLKHVYRECRGPGTYFCNTVYAVYAPHQTDACIAMVLHQYDV